MEAAIIDTKAFQRLRKIRQLGATYIVYPGGSHSRFEHCLGVVAMADRICDAVSATRTISVEERQVIRLAALLHDVGHLPFGHTLEDEVGLFGRHDSDTRVDALLGPDTEIGRVVTIFGAEATLKRARAVLHHDAAKTLPKDSVFMADIVSNTICADLLDYLRRDFYHLGLSYNFDDRLFDYMTVGLDNEGRLRFAINLFKSGKFRHDAATQILEILNLRYTLAECALFHHAKDAHSAMLSRALLESEFLLSLAGQARAGEHAAELRDRYEKQPGSQVSAYFEAGMRLDPGILLEMGDDDLVKRLAEDKNPTAACLAQMIEARQLYGMALEVGYDLANAANVQGRIVTELHRAPAGRFAMERRIEDELTLPRGCVLLYCPSEEMNSKVALVHVVDSSGIAVPLVESEKRSNNALTGGFLEAQLTRFRRLWRMYVFVHPSIDEKAREWVKRYVRAVYYLNTPKLPAEERERAAEQEVRALATEIIGERHGDLSWKELHELKSSVLVEMKDGSPDRILRDLVDGFELHLRRRGSER